MGSICASSTLDYDLKYLDTSNIIDFNYFLVGCIHINLLDLSSFNTSKSKIMKKMQTTV